MAPTPTAEATAFVTRRSQDGDSAMLDEGFYIFELVVAGATRCLLPLVLNPESETLTEQFAVTTTPGGEGALYAEENGIVLRRFTMRGTFGIKEKPLPHGTMQDLKAGGREITDVSHGRKQDYIGRSPTKSDPNFGLTGYAHLQLLQDRIFRDYGDLKRDPSTAADVELFLHITRDKEVWRVLPETFSVPRDSAHRTISAYEISLIITGDGRRATPHAARNPLSAQPADSSMLAQNLSTDMPWGEIDAPSFTARKEVKRPEPRRIAFNARRDLIRLLTELSPDYSWWQDLSSGVRALMQQVTGSVNKLVRYTTDFADGVIQAGRTIVGAARALVALADSVISALEDIWEGVLELIAAPLSIMRSLRNLTQHLITAFASAAAATENLFDAYSDFSFDPSRPENQTDLPRTLRGKFNTGTAATPSEAEAASRVPAFDSIHRAPPSVRADVIRQGDTLQTIAARTDALNRDVRRWIDIARLNNLRSPFISELGLPNTLRAGATILVPSTAAPESTRRVIALDVPADADISERAFGRDFELIEVANGVFDWHVNDSGDDFAEIAGRENLAQGLRRRILERRGTVPFFPDVGSDETIGHTMLATALREVSFTRAIEADPRILYVSRLDLAGTAGDTLVASIDAVVYGLVQRENLILPAA